MKKVTALILVVLSLCFTLTACFGKNYPGNVKPKYWVSEDRSLLFWFPAEAGHGNAAGDYIINEETRMDLILDWDTRRGVVEVKTAGYEPVFTANTTTNAAELTCTFEITFQADGYHFPDELVFVWTQSIS